MNVDGQKHVSNKMNQARPIIYAEIAAYSNLPKVNYNFPLFNVSIMYSSYTAWI